MSVCLPPPRLNLQGSLSGTISHTTPDLAQNRRSNLKSHKSKPIAVNVHVHVLFQFCFALGCCAVLLCGCVWCLACARQLWFAAEGANFEPVWIAREILHRGPRHNAYSSPRLVCKSTDASDMLLCGVWSALMLGWVGGMGQPPRKWVCEEAPGGSTSVT